MFGSIVNAGVRFSLNSWLTRGIENSNNQAEKDKLVNLTSDNREFFCLFLCCCFFVAKKKKNIAGEKSKITIPKKLTNVVHLI